MAAYIVDSVRNPFKGKSFFLVESSAEISTVPYLPSPPPLGHWIFIDLKIVVMLTATTIQDGPSRPWMGSPKGTEQFPT